MTINFTNCVSYSFPPACFSRTGFLADPLPHQLDPILRTFFIFLFNVFPIGLYQLLSFPHSCLGSKVTHCLRQAFFYHPIKWATSSSLWTTLSSSAFLMPLKLSYSLSMCFFVFLSLPTYKLFESRLFSNHPSA